MLKTPIGKLRVMGFLEGMSFLILLFISMPLKYMFDTPEAVSVNGMIHGGLFVVYMLIVAYVTFKVRWSFKWAAGAFIVAFIPFGNFILDHQLKKKFVDQRERLVA
ncbi:DUF3817 domain-containing protein [Halobacillus litoralis]|uniref:DUF3817 domain-containing protein n=1 Tax=Halobacillus litoralis TaxID=45668 RepID=UPI001CFE8B2C|nr:DUF3817 domain-containing protein [Halobacillus litoralis]